MRIQGCCQALLGLAAIVESSVSRALGGVKDRRSPLLYPLEHGAERPPDGILIGLDVVIGAIHGLADPLRGHGVQS